MASLEEVDAAEASGEPEPTYSTEDLWAYIERRRAGRNLKT